MSIINMSDYYKGEHLNTVSIVGDQVLSAQIEANVYRRCIEECREYSGFNMNRVIANSEAHLKGVYSCMLGKEVEYDDVTVEDVRNIADRFMVDGNRYHTRGSAINDKNFRNVLFEISMLTTAGLAAHSSAPRVGFLDAKGEPLTVSPDVLMPEEPEAVPEPKRPGFFKSLLHNMFGLFKGAFERYENETRAYEDYQGRLDRYNRAADRINEINAENSRQSEALKEAYDNECEVQRANERDHREPTNFNSLTNSNAKTTDQVVQANGMKKTAEMQ